MPFDPIGFKETFPFIPSKEGLRVLARALRAPMPENFWWNFFIVGDPTECGYVGCAMGLSHFLWGENSPSDSTSMSKMFNFPHIDAKRLFLPRGPLSGKYHKITPPMVADAIDRYLDTGEIWPKDLRP